MKTYRRPLVLLLFSIFSIFVCIPGYASENGNVLALERLGAGPPGGWLVGGDSYSWETETETGKLGPGAGRIRFDDSGNMELTSPARRLESGKPYTLLLWLRSEPGGAEVSLSLHDNETRAALAFEKTVIVTEDWQQFRVTHVLPEAIKDCYYLHLAGRGAGATLWLDGFWLGLTDAEPPAEWQPEWHPAAVALSPVEPWGVIAGDAPLRYQAHVAGVTTEGCRLETRVVSTSGESTGQPSVALDTSGDWKATCEVSGDIAGRFGMFRVEATKDAVFVVREWERVVRESQMVELRRYLYPDPFLSIIGKGGMELFICVDPERYITMARYAVEAGRPDVSEMSEIHAVTNGTIATVTGKWKAPNVVFGLGEHRFTALLLKVDGAWKVAGMFMGTQTEY